MPELPEVETIVRDLGPRLTGRTLHTLRLFKPDVLRDVTKARFLRVLRGNMIAGVSRRAKHIVLLLTTGHRLVIQPRMTGSLIVYDRALTPDDKRHVVLQVGIGGGASLVYRDVRRLGTMHLLDESAWTSYTGRIGPEPLDDAFDLAAFRASLRGSRQAIKKVLMDQRRLAGVGNIYANEALFRARIDPSRGADQIDRAAAKRLYRAVRDVLTAAIDARGTTVRDYRTGTGGRGSFQFELRVYGRGGEGCVRCDTRLITTHAIDGRATTFCWRCQASRRPQDAP